MYWHLATQHSADESQDHPVSRVPVTPDQSKQVIFSYEPRDRRFPRLKNRIQERRREMVAAVRRGDPLREVARRFGVALSTVQLWMARAGSQRLDRVDWADRPDGPARPVNRSAQELEDLVLGLRRELKGPATWASSAHVRSAMPCWPGASEPPRRSARSTASSTAAGPWMAIAGSAAPRPLRGGISPPTSPTGARNWVASTSSRGWSSREGRRSSSSTPPRCTAVWSARGRWPR